MEVIFKSRFSYLFLLSTFLFSGIKAQDHFPDPAYLLTIQGDTIFGFVHEKSLFNSSVILLQTNHKSNLLRSYKLNDISRVVVKPDRIYIPFNFDYKNEPIHQLMRLTMEGEVSIYFTFLKKKRKAYFLENEGDLVHVNQTGFGHLVSFYFRDCTSWRSLYPEIEKENFSYGKLLAATLAYNECKNSEEVSEVYLGPEKSGAFFGTRMAVLFNRASLPELSYYSELEAKGIYPGGGLFLGYQANDHFIMKTEINLVQRGAKDEQVNVPPLNRTDVVSDFDFDFAFVEMVLMVQYNFGKKRMEAYVFGGPSVSYALWDEVTELKYTDNGPVLGRQTELSSNFQLGIYGGGGLMKALNAKNEIFLELRYGIELDRLTSTILTWDLRLTSFQIGFGMIRRI